MTTTEPPRAACAGQPDLFEATDEASHLLARAICRECPVRLDCKALARTQREKVGTWAGSLYGASSKPGVRVPQLHPADADYTDDEARECFNAYARGEKGDYISTGRAVYRRRLRRAQREAERGAA